MSMFRIFSQWRRDTGNWCFVPFSVYGGEHFCGFVIFNFCFEFARTEQGKEIRQAMSR